MHFVLQRFTEEGGKLRPKKCFFGLQEMDYLGYTVYDGEITLKFLRQNDIPSLFQIWA
jgi:hypothetical protein